MLLFLLIKYIQRGTRTVHDRNMFYAYHGNLDLISAEEMLCRYEQLTIIGLTIIKNTFTQSVNDFLFVMPNSLTT